jgi:uncharacterized protein (TIGR02246 family)
MISADEQQIRELVAAWMSATKTGDIEQVLALMTDDAVFLVAGQAPFGKQKFAETMRAPLGKPRAAIDASSEIQEIQVAGDIAYGWSKLRVEIVPPGGEPIVRAGHTLTVFRKTGGRWLLARDANLLVPVER